MSRVYLVAGYNNGNILRDYTVFLTRKLAQSGDVYYFSNGTIAKSELQKLHNHTVYADSVVHNGNDFGSWQYLIYHHNWKMFLQYDEVVFCNDKTYAPTAHLQNISAYLKLQNYDFWSMTEKYDNYPENNGQFIIFKHNVVKNTKFQEFWNNIIFRNRRDTYRSILAPFLKELGFNGKSDYKNYKPFMYSSIINSAIRLNATSEHENDFARKPDILSHIKTPQTPEKHFGQIIKNLKNSLNIFHADL